MIVENFIWSGGSMGAASGFGECSPKVNREFMSNPFKFHHPDLKKYFKEPYNNENIIKQIKQLSFPNILGKKLGAKNIQNISQGGLGYEIHTRCIMSYIINNFDSLDLQKTIVAMDLTSITRFELTKYNIDDKIEFHFIDGNNNDDVKNVYLKHFHYEHRFMQFLNYMLLFKGWLKSIGVEFFMFGYNGYLENILFYNINRIDEYRKDVNYPFNTYDEVEYPKIEEMLSRLGIYELPIIFGKTFATDGFHNDTHFTPEGHEYVSDLMYDIIISKLNNIK